MVLPSFAYDRDKWQSGERVSTELWVINDHFHEVPDVSVSWRVVDSRGRTVYSGDYGRKVDLAADSSRKLTDVSFAAGAPGKYTLWATIRDNSGKTISENSYEYAVGTTVSQPGGN